MLRTSFSKNSRKPPVLGVEYRVSSAKGRPTYGTPSIKGTIEHLLLAECATSCFPLLPKLRIPAQSTASGLQVKLVH